MAKLPIKVISPSKAVHVSPHDIDKFDTKYIGRGLGRQNEGRGLYFTEPDAPGVPWYADLMTKMKVKAKSTGKTYDKGDEFLEVQDEIFKILENVYPTSDKREIERLAERGVSALLSPRFTPPLVKGKDLEVAKILDEHFEPVDVKKPWKYDVNLNVGDPNDLPILNTHITQQPAKYKKALKDLVNQTYPSSDLTIKKEPIPTNASFPDPFTRISMDWAGEPFAGRNWLVESKHTDAAIKQALNEIAYGQKNHPLRTVDKYFADKSPDKLREQGIPGFRYNTHEQVPPNEWGKRKDTVMVDDRLIDIINKSKIGIGGVVLGGAVLNQAGGSDAQAKPPDPLRSIEPDFKPVDLGRQGEITNLEPKNDSLYDWTTYKLAENWFGDDRQGVEKARRFLDTTGIGHLSFAGDWVTKNIREHGLNRPEEIVGNLLLGAMPVPPGMKKGAKAAEEVAKEVKQVAFPANDLGDAYKKLSKVIGDPSVDLNSKEVTDLTKFIQDSLNTESLNNKFKTLKEPKPPIQIHDPYEELDKYFVEDPLPSYIEDPSIKHVVQDKPQTYGELIDKYKTEKPELFNQEPLIAGEPKYYDPENPANDLLHDYETNTNATYDDLDKFFNGKIPDYKDLTEQQLVELDDFVQESKNAPQIYDDPADQLNYDEHPGYDEQIPKTSHGSPTGIDAWHVSSHKFDDFNINKVLTGEGTGMEGLGMYTSNNPPGKDYYTRQFTTANTKMFPYDAPKQTAAERIAHVVGAGTGITAENALKGNIRTMEIFKNSGSTAWRKQDDEILKVFYDWDKNGIPDGAISTPYVYDVNLDVDPKMLPEYRKPLIEQDQKVQKLIRDAYMEHPGVSPTGNTDIKTHEDIYNEIFRANMAKRGLKNPSRVAYVRPDNYGLDKNAKETVDDLIEQYGSLEEVSKGLASGDIQVPPSWMDDINAVLVHMEDTAIPNTPAGIQAKQIVDYFKGDVEGSLNFMHGKGYGKYDPNMADDITKILQGWHNFGVNPGVKSLGTPRDAAMETTNYLYKRGIPGHQYLPGEGAYGDQGTRNFVSYHHEYMKILKRIKLALAAGISTAVLAQQYGSDTVEAAQSQ